MAKNLAKQYTFHIPEEDRELINRWLDKQLIAKKNKSLAGLIKYAVEKFGNIDLYSPEAQYKMYQDLQRIKLDTAVQTQTLKEEKEEKIDEKDISPQSDLINRFKGNVFSKE